MFSQGSRLLKAIGIVPPKAAPKITSDNNTKQKTRRAVTQTETTNDDSDSDVSSFTASEIRLLNPEWLKSVRQDNNNNGKVKEKSSSAPKSLADQSNSSHISLQQPPVNKAIVTRSTKKVNHWLDTKKKNHAISSIEPNQSSHESPLQISREPFHPNVPAISSDVSVCGSSEGLPRNVLIPNIKPNKPDHVLNSVEPKESSHVCLPQLSSEAFDPKEPAISSDSCGFHPLEVPDVHNSKTKPKKIPCITKSAKPKELNTSRSQSWIEPSDMMASNSSGSNVSCSQAASPDLHNSYTKPNAGSVKLKEPGNAYHSARNVCDPNVPFSPEIQASTSTQPSSAPSPLDNMMSNSSKQNDHLGPMKGIITPEETSNILRPHTEKDNHSHNNITPFNEVDCASSSREGLKVRKNLFPSDKNNEDVLIMDADETLSSHLDRCGGSITLVVGATSTELLPDMSSSPSIEGLATINNDTLSEEPKIENNVNNNKKRKRNVDLSDKTPPKKRRVNRNEWKSTKAKLANQSGIAHVSRRGKEKRARALQPPCGEKCRKKCTSKISDELRKKLLTKYWGLQDKVSQWMFLSKLVKTMDIKCRKVIVEDEDEAFRKHTYAYSLCDPDEKVPQLVSVCQTMFLSTFDISISVVKTSHCKSSPDKRGKHVSNRKRLSPILINSVKEHIKQFPLIPSHYCRADSRKKYLDETLTVAKMHRMYLLTRETGDRHIATIRQYRDVFNTCFNLSFFHPKKDQCSLCLEYDSVSPGVQKSDLQIQEYNKHHQDKKQNKRSKKG